MKQTSIEAYQSIKPDLKTLHKRIMHAFKKIKSGSFRDISRAAQLTDAQVWRRLNELEKKNLIEENGTKICDISKRRVTVYKIIE